MDLEKLNKMMFVEFLSLRFEIKKSISVCILFYLFISLNKLIDGKLNNLIEINPHPHPLLI